MIITLLALPLSLLGTQQPIAQRLDGRVTPDVAAVVEELGSAASARGLPVDPLIQKAIEGSAKGVPAERVLAAVRVVAMQLDTAALALHEGGVDGDTLAIAAGAFAINAGLSGTDITALARIGASAQALTEGLRVAATLSAIGLPPAHNIDLIGIRLRSGKSPADLPRLVLDEMARGSTPAQAAAGLEHAAGGGAGARGGQHGPPPGHGTPPPHPPAPPHPPPPPHPPAPPHP